MSFCGHIDTVSCPNCAPKNDGLTNFSRSTNGVEIPPLGLTPRFIHEEKRLKEINDAMLRYIYANKEIPIEWHMERTELVKSLNDYYNRPRNTDELYRNAERAMQQQHHDVTPCYDKECSFDHPNGGPFDKED